MSVVIENLAQGYATSQKAKSGGRKHVTMSVANTGLGDGGGLLATSGLSAEARAALMGTAVTAHPCLWSPVHVKTMKQQKEQAATLASFEARRGSKTPEAIDVGDLVVKPAKRKWIVRMLGGEPNYVPNEYESCFYAEELGVELYAQVGWFFFFSYS